MAFENIKKSQPKVVQLLENSIKKDRLSHAYLFEGEKGTKKFDTALYFAQMLLCTEDKKPCGKCHNCRRIPHHTHPNVYVVEPINRSIRKNQIMDLQAEFAKTSVEPGPKIYVIRDIDLINISAANSLLKFLEEPHPNIYAVLTTANINRILPTIISRSQVVQFSSLNRDIVFEELFEDGYPEETSKIIANLTNSIGEAIEIANNEFFLVMVDLVKDIYQIIESNQEPLLIYFNEKSSIIYQENEFSNLFLSCLILYQKDIINYHTGDVENIVFVDAIDTIKTIAGMKDKNRLIDELEEMLSLKARLDSYINQRLAYDNLLLRLEKR